MYSILLDYPGFIVGLATVLTMSITIYSADKAKNYRLTLSELTIDRESRLTLSIGMIIIGIFAGITLLRAVNDFQVITPWFTLLIIVTCGLFILTGMALYLRMIAAHYLTIGGYFICAYITQFAVGYSLFSNPSIQPPLPTLILTLPTVSIICFILLATFRPKAWYWEVSFSVFTALFLVALNLTWL